MKANLFIKATVVAMVGLGLGVFLLNFSVNNTDHFISMISDKETAPQMIDQPISFEGISVVNVNTGQSDIVIQQSNDTKGKLAIKSNDKELSGLMLDKKNHTLSISLNGSSHVKAIELSLPKQIQILQVNAVSGDIKLGNTTLKEITLHSVSGDVEMSGLNNKINKMNVATVGGDIVVNTNNYSQFKMNTKSISGDVSIKVGLTNSTVKAGKTPIITLNSVSGDITVK